MGVEAAVGEDATDWLARGDHAPGNDFAWPGRELGAPTSAPLAATGASPSTGGSAPPSPRTSQGRTPQAATARRARPASAPETNARAEARNAQSLAELSALLAAYDGCALKSTAKNLCFYRGAERARIMLIGEAPGREEDLEGRPFVGPTGKLLDKMLAAVGLVEADVHITNAVYWRPPGNRTPTLQEIQACRPFLERQIELVAPQIIVPLGGAAAKGLFEANEGIMRLRGQWRDLTIEGHTARAMATLHPAYLLRTPIAKRLAWRDLLAITHALSPDAT